MNFKRAIGFGLSAYLLSFAVYVAVAFIPGTGSPEEITTVGYAIGWVFYIPVILLLAKWYFKKDPPNTKKGFFLGLITIAVSLALDGLAILGTYLAGESIKSFTVMYTSWEFYTSIVWVVALCTFAGFEFDKTYTKRDSRLEK
jgi:hypothetical protein